MPFCLKPVVFFRPVVEFVQQAREATDHLVVWENATVR
jgi:hypothetical protein